MQLAAIDWILIGAFFATSLVIGLAASRRAQRSSDEFFLSGRSMPWWIVGVSMVATTFSADTPNLVTDLVRTRGIAGNWAWWAFLLTGMLTVFVYAKLWRRSGVTTDIEFYELRYSGKSAAFLRGFRAVYLGLLFNVVVMGLVCLAAVKIGQVLVGSSAVMTLTGIGLVTLAYTWAGGLRAVLLTDVVQFALAMVGSLWAAVYVVGLESVGGLDALLDHAIVYDKLDLVPAMFDAQGQLAPEFVKLLLVPIAVQWWAAWYPGAEPGGGGYVAQRMFAARDEQHAVAGTLLFNAAHYALRPWPWVIIALASLVVYPDLDSLAAAFPHVPPEFVGHDLAYPAMLTHLPAGLAGLVIASLIAAVMSTLSTHLNWGASYIVNDVYLRFVDRSASAQQQVRVGRVAMVAMMLAAAVVATQLEHAAAAFDLILMLGSGTGLLYLLRWFWWRINAVSELVAMALSFVVSCYFTFVFQQDLEPALRWPSHVVFVVAVAMTTAGWLAATWLTRPCDRDTLVRFCRIVRPGGPGWRRFAAEARGDDRVAPWSVPRGLLAASCGCVAIYSVLLGVGSWLLGDRATASWLLVSAGLGGYGLVRSWPRERSAEPTPHRSSGSASQTPR